MKNDPSLVPLILFVVLVGLAGILAVGAVIYLFVVIGRMKRERVRQASENYDTALQFLRANPTHPDARAACIERGRAYYSMVMPDTVTVHTQGGSITGVSNHQNNAGAREARIMSDIEAQIGHLRLAADGGVATAAPRPPASPLPPAPPAPTRPPTTATFCASCGKARGGDGLFCGKCGERFPVPA